MGTYKVGIVGCGHISGAHIRAWAKQHSFHVNGVFDVNRQLAEERAREFGISRCYDGLDDLISNSDVVDVCTPPQTHANIARQILNSGKHLVIEKPVVTQLEEWTELHALAKASSGKVAVIHNLKYSPAIQKAKRWVEEGRIGDLVGLTREFMTNPEADRMLRPEPHWSHRLPGGRWFETLPHELYLTHYFLGPLALDSVTTVRTGELSHAVPAEEVLISLKGARAIGTIRFSARSAGNKRMLTLHGTKGEIVVDILSHAAVLVRLQDSSAGRTAGLVFLKALSSIGQASMDRAGYLARRIRRENPHSTIIDVFARNLEGRGPEATPLEEVDYVVRNCELIGRAVDAAASRHEAERAGPA